MAPGPPRRPVARLAAPLPPRPMRPTLHLSALSGGCEHHCAGRPGHAAVLLPQVGAAGAGQGREGALPAPGIAACAASGPACSAWAPSRLILLAPSPALEPAGRCRATPGNCSSAAASTCGWAPSERLQRPWRPCVQHRCGQLPALCGGRALCALSAMGCCCLGSPAHALNNGSRLHWQRCCCQVGACLPSGIRRPMPAPPALLPQGDGCERGQHRHRAEGRHPAVAVLWHLHLGGRRGHAPAGEAWEGQGLLGVPPRVAAL